MDQQLWIEDATTARSANWEARVEPFEGFRRRAEKMADRLEAAGLWK